MDNELMQIEKTISNLKSKEIVNLLGIGINMAQKYKRFTSLPRLDGAVLMEDTFKIPARSWADIKKYKDSKNV